MRRRAFLNSVTAPDGDSGQQRGGVFEARGRGRGGGVGGGVSGHLTHGGVSSTSRIGSEEPWATCRGL